jgi:hypothetical protein
MYRGFCKCPTSKKSKNTQKIIIEFQKKHTNKTRQKIYTKTAASKRFLKPDLKNLEKTEKVKTNRAKNINPQNNHSTSIYIFF